MEIPTTHDDPSTLLGALVAFAGAVIVLVVAAGIVPESLHDPLLGVATTGLPLVVAFLIRRRAWAPASVETAVDVARRGVDPGDDASGRPHVHPDQLPERRRIDAELARLTTSSTP